jgi:hypothetical protein
MRSIALRAALVGLAVLAGCTIPKRRPEPVPKADLGYRRVAIVEFHNRTSYERPATEFPALLGQKLAARTVATDAVVVPRSALPELGDPFVEGRLPVGVLVDLRRKYRADAVIIGSVEDYDPYWQPSVSLTVKVIDTATAEFPFELAERWHAGEREVRAEIDDYYRRNRGSDECRFGPELFVTSPHYFLRFVADQVAERLIAQL